MMCLILVLISSAFSMESAPLLTPETTLTSAYQKGWKIETPQGEALDLSLLQQSGATNLLLTPIENGTPADLTFKVKTKNLGNRFFAQIEVYSATKKLLSASELSVDKNLSEEENKAKILESLHPLSSFVNHQNSIASALSLASAAYLFKFRAAHGPSNALISEDEQNVTSGVNTFIKLIQPQA